MHSSISIVMPALNEEANLRDAVRNAIAFVQPYYAEWEILIFNDGSTDATGRVADDLARAEPRIRVFHHATSKNLGGVYREGVRHARHEYLIMLPGDNENGSATLSRVLEKTGEADIVIPYVTNAHVRPVGRRLVSAAFVALVNLISGCRLRYYNGTVLHRTELLRRTPFTTDGFGYQAELLVRMIRAGHDYVEVGVELAETSRGGSRALRLRNFVQVFRFLVALLFHSRRPRPAASAVG